MCGGQKQEKKRKKRKKWKLMDENELKGRKNNIKIKNLNWGMLSQYFYNKFEVIGCYWLILVSKKIILVVGSN